MRHSTPVSAPLPGRRRNHTTFRNTVVAGHQSTTRRADLLTRSGLPNTQKFIDLLITMTGLSERVVRKAVFTGGVGIRGGVGVKSYIKVNWALDRLANRYFWKYRQRACTCGFCRSRWI
jgi:hypothetical protein